MGRHRSPDRPSKERLANMCKTMTAMQIAVFYEKDVKTIYSWCRQDGVCPLPSPGRGRKRIDMDNVIRLADSGMSTNEIASLYGVSHNLVVRRLQEIGWTKPDHSVPDPKGVNCLDHPELYSQKCEYGSGDVCMYVCAGMGRRPCPANDCTVYKKRTRKSGNGYGSTGAGSRWYD